MPCYTRYLVTTNFEGQDIDALIETLKSLGLFAHSGASLEAAARKIINTGRIALGKTSRNSDDIFADIKRGYAERVVTKQAQSKGYRVNKNTRTGKLELSR